MPSADREPEPIAPPKTSVESTHDAVTHIDVADAQSTVPGSFASMPQLGTTPGKRYTVGALIGQGGMGEVHLCYDEYIGRDVAMKTIHSSVAAHSELKARFLREAQVQARLEHPSVVPIYDLAVDPSGTPYFVMKRIQGHTFDEILQSRATGNTKVSDAYSSRRLLTAFGSVCQAVDYAHTRGVIHRDLKPGNIMMGAYGEVYVLDWGVAKVNTEAMSRRDTALDDARTAMTQVGTVIGTLGYMSPEQLLGGMIDGRSDVYALGAILFEILTEQPLHTGSSEQRTATTLSGAEARPSFRFPERAVPPELELICVRATARAPEDRFASPRELFEALERYLDGDRDVARRRELAKRHAASAAASAAIAITPKDADNSERGRAMRDAGHALALDPTNRDALETMSRLFAHPPMNIPDGAREILDRAHLGAAAHAARAGSLVFGSSLLWLPLLVFMGVRNWTWVTVAMATFACAGALSAVQGRRPRYNRSYLIIGLCFAGFMAMTRMFGSLVFVPTAAVALGVNYIHHPARLHKLAIGVAVIVVLLPVALEAFGIFPASYVFQGGALVIVPQMVAFPPKLTVGVLALINVMTMLLTLRQAWKMRLMRDDAETRLNVQTWQLRLMLPPEARAV